MADLLWALVLPVLVCVVIVFLIRFMFGLVSPRQGGGGGGGFGLIAFGWIVSAIVKVTGAIIVAVFDGLVMPLLRALGRGAGAGWKASVSVTARRSAVAGEPRRPVPSPFERRFWWRLPEDDDFDRWEREHYTEPREDER